jgi:hypothetical protein
VGEVSKRMTRPSISKVDIINRYPECLEALEQFLGKIA